MTVTVTAAESFVTVTRHDRTGNAERVFTARYVRRSGHRPLSLKKYRIVNDTNTSDTRK